MQMSKTWCLHGHTHSKFEFDDNIAKNFNVALDAHDCYPIEINEILIKIQEKWNKIHNEYEKQQSQLQKVKDMKIDKMLDFQSNISLFDKEKILCYNIIMKSLVKKERLNYEKNKINLQ